MEILINNKKAVLKKNTSFQLVEENSQFTGSDSYTLNITFPLKGCPENKKIFGDLDRVDADITNVSYKCSIVDRDYQKDGILTLTEITPSEVKTQFLEGRCITNFYKTFDDIYINELNLGAPVASTAAPLTQWNADNSYFPIPWVNNESGNIQNKVNYNSDNGTYSWVSSNYLSYMPKLSYITKLIFSALGYSTDLSAWEYHESLKKLIICNVLPAEWGLKNWQTALPHWTVSEFMEQLELFLNGEFSTNHVTKMVRFSFHKGAEDTDTVVELENVVDDFTSTVESEDDDCKYIGSANLEYSGRDDKFWNMGTCGWYIKNYSSKLMPSTYKYEIVDGKRTYTQNYKTVDNIRGFSDVPSMMGWLENVPFYDASDEDHPLPDEYGDEAVWHAEDINRYFMPYTLSYTIVGENRERELQRRTWIYPVNQFESRIVDEDSDNTKEIKILPPKVDWTDDTYGDLVYLEPGTLESADNSDNITAGEVGPRFYINPTATWYVMQGTSDDSHEYYTNIFVGFWDGFHKAYISSYLPRPYFDVVDVRADASYMVHPACSMNLAEQTVLSNHFRKYELNTKKKWEFSFLSDSIPDCKSVFMIKGHRFLCEKLTMTFTEKGRSQLIKGVFYEITQENTPTDIDA